MIGRSISERNWILSKFDDNKVKKISQEFGISEILSKKLHAQSFFTQVYG
jgi:hypothetical protein